MNVREKDILEIIEKLYCTVRENCAIRKVFIMSMKEIYEELKEGKKFKTVSDILDESLNISSDLVGSNKIMKELAKNILNILTHSSNKEGGLIDESKRT